jgi:hypothetical protein
VKTRLVRCMAHGTCIAVSTGVHLPTPYHIPPAMLDSTPRLIPHATTSTTAAMSNALRIRPVAEEPMPAPACGSSRAASCSLPWPVSPVHHVSCLSPRQNSRSRELTSPEYCRFVYSGIDNCNRLLRPKCYAAAPPNAVSKVSPARSCPFPLRRDDQYVFRLESSNNPQTFPLSTFSVNVLPVPLSPVGTS